MKRITTILFAAIASMHCALASPPGWSTNYNAALSQATGRGQPLLVYFTASWCGPCKLMARTTFNNEAVTQALNGLPHVVVDIDENRTLAETHGIEAVPTFEILTPEGDEVVRTTGYREAGEFLQWLTNSVVEVKRAAEDRKRMEEQLTATDSLMTSTDAGSLTKAAGQLFDLYAESEGDIRSKAAKRIVALSARKPVLVLEGLNHPRLIVRIHAANVLRARFDQFDIDPWSDAATRSDAVTRWRARLAAGQD
jgi:thiol-disulfide isomerase/thioredoxin